MASRLKRCPSCKIHIFENATSCPFCSTRIPFKGIVATTAGVVTLIAGIGCAYGCPDSGCSGGFGGAAGAAGAAGAGGESLTTGSTSSSGSGSSGTGGMGGAGGASINDAGTD